MTYEEILEGGRERAVKGVLDTRQLIPVSRYHTKLMQDIDEADWMGDFDTADSLRLEVDYVKKEISRGAIYIPMF